MKKLTLLRHAKSGWDDQVARDFDRPVNARGIQAALVMGKFMKAQGLSFDHILASPAVRVIETLEHVGVAMGKKFDPQWERRIYLASSVTIIDVIRDMSDEHDHILLGGHNPGMEDLVFDLVPNDGTSPLRDDVEEKYPTASLAELKLNIKSWADINNDCGVLNRFTRPRDLDPRLGPET